MDVDFEDLKAKSVNSSKVLTKFPKKTFESKVLFENSLFQFEMFKKNFLIKNKRHFQFYSDKFLFFKVIFHFSKFICFRINLKANSRVFVFMILIFEWNFFIMLLKIFLKTLMN